MLHRPKMSRILIFLSLRQKDLAHEEDCLYDANFLKMRFLHALQTGIRNGNFINDHHSQLKNSTTTDEELLECVTFAISNESEWPEKFSDKKKSDTAIFFIDEQQPKDNPFHLQIKELTVHHSKQLQSIRSEMKRYKKQCTGQLKHIYTQFAQSQAPLNNTTPRIPFP